MFTTLKETVCQITVFMICAQAMIHFRPKDSYEKYLRMLLGAMILIQIFQPFCQLFCGVTGQELVASVEQFQRELDFGLEEASKQALLAGQKLEDMSLLEVQERLMRQENETEEKSFAGELVREEGMVQEENLEQENPAESQTTEGISQVQIEVEIREE